MTVHLSKLQATGNDFLVTTAPLIGRDAVALCDRFTGVGADGLLILGPGRDGADATMTLYNADGTVAEMSGNGARCLAWAARRDGMGSPERLVVDTGWWAPGTRSRARRSRHGELGGLRHGTGDVRAGGDPGRGTDTVRPPGDDRWRSGDRRRGGDGQSASRDLR